MPVYYDDKDAREEFIKEVITQTGYDAADFAAYIYMDGQGLYTEENYACYKQVIDAVTEKFPTVEGGHLVEEIARVMRNEEEQYIDAWMGHFKGLMKKISEDKLGINDGHYYW